METSTDYLLSPIKYEDKEYLILVDAYSKVFGMVSAEVLKKVFQQSSNHRLTLAVIKIEFHLFILKSIFKVSNLRDNIHTIVSDLAKISHAINKSFGISIEDSFTMFALGFHLKAFNDVDSILFKINTLDFDDIGAKNVIYSGHSKDWEKLKLDIVHRWDRSYITYPNGAKYKVSIIITTDAIRKLIKPHDQMWASKPGFIPFSDVEGFDKGGVMIKDAVLKQTKKDVSVALKGMIMTELALTDSFSYEV